QQGQRPEPEIQVGLELADLGTGGRGGFQHHEVVDAVLVFPVGAVGSPGQGSQFSALQCAVKGLARHHFAHAEAAFGQVEVQRGRATPYFEAAAIEDEAVEAGIDLGKTRLLKVGNKE